MGGSVDPVNPGGPVDPAGFAGSAGPVFIFLL